MSKAIKWQIPFVSTIDKIRYRIDIYAEDDGTWDTTNPIQLTGGTNPIKTEEDKSDDFFAPVRGQTGTIEVVTKLPNGGTLDINDLLPANNIDHPVRLVSISGSTETIEWQGFMSCEAYSQNYTSIPDTFSFPIISVLEAMESVQLNESNLKGLVFIAEFVKKVLLEIQTQSGVECFTDVYFSRTDHNIWMKMINTSILFEEKAYSNEYDTTFLVNGEDAKTALKMICTYMGWIARESGTAIYLCRINEKIGMYKSPLPSIYTNRENQDLIELDIESIYASRWKGTNHKRSISAGAKSVEVVAKVKSNNFNLTLNKFPFGDASNITHESVYWEGFSTKYIYLQVNYNNSAYNNDAYPGYYKFRSTSITTIPDRSFIYDGQTTRDEFLERLTLFSSDVGIWANPHVSGAILIRYAIKDREETPDSLESGLYCPLMICGGVNDTPIYKMRTFKTYTFSNGKINIKADMLFLAFAQGDGGFWANVLSDKINGTIGCQDEEMTMALRVGTSYWNGVSWVRTRVGFQVPLKDQGIDIEIPTSFVDGDVELEIWSGVTTTHHNALVEVIFRSLSLDYKPNTDLLASDQSENKYYRLIGANFRDEVSIDTDFASNNYNKQHDSIILDTPQEMLNVLPYYLPNGTTDSRRPEVDLLSRAAEYYSAARQRLELIAQHLPTPLPLIRLNGISPDTRKYLPLAESRDWREDTSTFTCFETPKEEPSES